MRDLQLCKFALLMVLWLSLCKEAFRFLENDGSVWSLFSEMCKTSQKRKESLDNDSPHKKRYLEETVVHLTCSKPWQRLPYDQYSLHTRHYATCLTHIHTSHFMPKIVHWVNFIIITFWLRQSRSREVKQLAQDHTASKQRCLSSNTNLPNSAGLAFKPQTAPSPLLVGKDKILTPGSQQNNARNREEIGLEEIVKIICSFSAP